MRITKLLPMVFPFIFVGSQAFAADSTTITVTATVVASCSMTTDKNTLDLGNIDASEFSNAASGGLLEKYSKSFTLTATCYGSQNYDYTIKTAGKVVNNNCVRGDKSSNIAFCLRHDNNPVNFNSSGTATISRASSATTTTLTVTPQKPETAVPWYGKNTFTMTITISPV